MKRFPAFFFLGLILTISSCQNEDMDELMIPPALIGLWEVNFYNDYIELDYVTSYLFNSNGTYVHSSTLREKDGSQDLGYNFRSTGNYRVEGNKIIFELIEHLHKPHGASKMFYSKDELDRAHIEGNAKFSSNFEIRNEGQQLFFPGYIVGGDGIVADQTLFRVN